jgi:drug/metabolite transporter (DMT)-like permease
MLLSVVAYTGIQSAARYLGPAVDSWAKTFYRCALTFILVLLYMRARREPFRAGSWPLLLLRGMGGAVAVTSYFWTIDLVGLLKATLYSYSHPLFAIIFGVLFFGERGQWWMLGAIVLAAGGLYLIVDPAFDTLGAGDVVGLICSLAGGISRSTVRALRKSDTPGNVILVFMACAMVFSALGILILPSQRWGFAATDSATVPRIWLTLGLMGLFSAAGNLLMTNAYRRLTTATGSILTLLVLPLTAVVAVLWFHEPLTGRRAIGGVLILAAGLLASRPRRREDATGRNVANS